MHGTCPECQSDNTSIVTSDDDFVDYHCDECECEFTDEYEVEYTYSHTNVNIHGNKYKGDNDE